eukprot:Em0001g3789a
MAAAVHLRASTFDFVAFGKTGSGKSTTCNILVGANDKMPNRGIVAMRATEEIQDIYNSSPVTYFETSCSVESCTKRCKVLSNGPIRVLDVPGFADSEDSKASVCERNLTLIRNVMRVQEELKLSFKRVLYFLPQRGAVRKIDGYLKDELAMFYNHFGRGVFDNMILIATIDSSYQQQGMGDEDLQTTQDTLKRAIEMVWKRYAKTHPEDPNPPNCPPVMYVPLCISTQDLLTKIKEASVPMVATSATLTIEPNMCVKCGWSVIKVNDEPFQVTNDKEVVQYSDSVCHPEIIPRYTLLQKMGGGILHMATLGSALVYETILGKETWPGFTNSDELCVNCNEVPGRTPGCMQINAEFTSKRQTYTVKHSNQVTRN